MDGWCLIYTEVFMVQILPTIELKKKKKKKRKEERKKDLKLILRKSNNGVAMRR